MSFAANGMLAFMALAVAASKGSLSSTGRVADCVPAGWMRHDDPHGRSGLDWLPEVPLEVDVGKLACEFSLGSIVFQVLLGNLSPVHIHQIPQIQRLAFSEFVIRILLQAIGYVVPEPLARARYPHGD